jgi:hypothetical protein
MSARVFRVVAPLNITLKYMHPKQAILLHPPVRVYVKGNIFRGIDQMTGELVGTIIVVIFYYLRMIRIG